MILTRDDARRVLLATVGPRPLPEAADAVVQALRCVQIDPIDRIGPNADLVAFARTATLRRGDVYTAAGFEHYAKEWCRLPPEAFPYYREQAKRTPTWRHTRRMAGLSEEVLQAVLDEVTDRGPCTPVTLGDHGRSAGSGHAWFGPAKMGTLALTVLALRCSLVVTGRSRGARVYDTPQRALPTVASQEVVESFASWAVKERVRACGMLSLGAGPWWSMLKEARRDGTVDALVTSGVLAEVGLEGTRRRYLVEPRSLEAAPQVDDRMRLLGPLDPLIWNRELIEHAFGFRYVWEVYKPAAKREFGYYVVPLLHRGRFVGRYEGRWMNGKLETANVWREAEGFDDEALDEALALHSTRL